MELLWKLPQVNLERRELMSILYNETPFNTIKYNGKTLKKIIFNGKTVFEEGTKVKAPQVELSIYDAEREGYVVPSISIYNPNEFPVYCHIVKLAFGSINHQLDYTYALGVSDWDAPGDYDIAAKGTGLGRFSLRVDTSSLPVPYGGYLEVYLSTADGSRSKNVITKHDDWNSTSTSRE